MSPALLPRACVNVECPNRPSYFGYLPCTVKAHTLSRNLSFMMRVAMMLQLKLRQRQTHEHRRSSPELECGAAGFQMS